MSNSAVADVYSEIVKRVIESCGIDFEESGVDRATLMEMQAKWQERLSSFRVADQTWDPKPPVQGLSTLPSNVPKTEDEPTVAPAYHSPTNTNGVKIKTEPGYEGYTSAQDRAANILKQQYGHQATASLQHMQQPGGFALPGQTRPQGLQMPGQQQPRPPQQYPTPQHQQAALSNAQTDGADDVEVWSVARAGRKGGSDADRVAADGQIRAQIDQMAARMDSGLFVPLAEHKAQSSRKRKAPSHGRSPVNRSAPPTLPSIPQMDGNDDDDIKDEDDEKDEDAINSDLDDSEDELNHVGEEEDEGAAINEAILCTYDKVQRVKNKWKCTLKDGILSTRGKDYVFHKAQGEFEW